MKNTIFLPLIAVLLAQSLSSCQKSTAPDRSHVGGRILEYGTDTPIEGAKVNISGWSGSIGGGGSGGGSTLMTTTYSDSDGYYHFDNLDGNQVLLVNATKEGYFTDLDTEESVLDDGNYDDVDVRLKPYAWLKVTIRNESGAYQITAPGYVSSDSGQSFFLDQAADSTFILFSKGNQDYKYLFSVIPVEGGSSTKELDAFHIYTDEGQQIMPSLENSAAPWFKVYLAGHDTTGITITY